MIVLLLGSSEIGHTLPNYNYTNVCLSICQERLLVMHIIMNIQGAIIIFDAPKIQNNVLVNYQIGNFSILL